MTEIDLQDDDALRFAQRVLESDAPAEDRRAARDGIVAIRTRLRKEHAPAQQPIASDSYDMMYDKVDRFLRCNLGDDDYAEYSAALDSLAAPVVAQPDDAKDAARYRWLRDRCAWTMCSADGMTRLAFRLPIDYTGSDSSDEIDSALDVAMSKP